MFKGCHFPKSVILTCIRWYLRYKLGYRDLEEMMAERGVHVDHATINRWVVRFAPMLVLRARRHKRRIGKSWRMDETSIKVRGQWKSLSRAVDKQGHTVDSRRRLPTARACPPCARVSARCRSAAGSALAVVEGFAVKRYCAPKLSQFSIARKPPVEFVKNNPNPKRREIGPRDTQNP